LIDEWQPSGPTEEDAVFSLANLMWRKCRAQKFVQAKLNAAALFSGSPTSVENQGLTLFSWFMDSEPETAFERYAETLLTSANVSHLKQKFPRANYESTSEWAEAVKAEINSLSPGWSTPRPQVASEDELNLRERLDAMIARQVKQLAQTKAMKQMLRQASTT